MKYIFAVLAVAGLPALAQSNFPSGTALSTPAGRFVFGQISSVRADQYVLDSQTGRIWRAVCMAFSKADASKCERVAFEPTSYLDYAGKESAGPPLTSGKP